MAQQQAVHKFVLGSKELEGKTAEFQYDRGWYSITDIVGEERNVIYKSRNAQEAYQKWNVYIGRKKERPVPEERRKTDNQGSERTDKNDSAGRAFRENRNTGDSQERRDRDRNRRREISEQEDEMKKGGQNRHRRDHRKGRQRRES